MQMQYNKKGGIDVFVTEKFDEIRGCTNGNVFCMFNLICGNNQCPLDT